MNSLRSYPDASSLRMAYIAFEYKEPHSRTGYGGKLRATHVSSVHRGAALGLCVGWMYSLGYIIYSIGFMTTSLFFDNTTINNFDVTNTLIILLMFARHAHGIAVTVPNIELLSQGRAAAASVFRLIDEENNEDINEKNIPIDTQHNIATLNLNDAIYFDNVNFAYPNRSSLTVLRDSTLTARVGEVTALVGVSGCGKSTSLSLLLRFYDPTSGRISINGESIDKFDLHRFRQAIGVVSQEPILFSVTIFENIRFGKLNATREEVEKAAHQAQAHEFIMKLPQKYDTIVGEHGVLLSGGEKQRIVLARAYIRQPQILLLDEATSALDTRNERIVQEALYDVCKGRTTIVVAHRLTTIQNAHRIYVVDGGKVIEEGTHETLMSKEGSRYCEMFKAQELEKAELADDHLSIDESESEQHRHPSHLSSVSNDESDREDAPVEPSRKAIFLRLFLMNKPEWIVLFIGCIACLVTGAFQTAFVLFLTKIIQSFGECTYAERKSKAVLFCALLLVLAILTLVVRFGQYVVFAFAGSKLTMRIRSRTFACLLRQEVAFFDRPENSSGAICNRLSSEPLALQHLIGTRFSLIFEAVATVGLGIVVGFCFSWRLTLILTIFIVLLFILALAQVYWLGNLKKKSNEILERASSFSMEIICNMRTVKQLAIESVAHERFSRLIYEASQIHRRGARVSMLIYGMMWGTPSFVIVILYFIGLSFVNHGKMTVDDLILIFAFITFLYESMRIVANLIIHIGGSLVAVQSFFQLLDRKPLIDNGSNEGEQLTGDIGQITFNKVKFSYPLRPEQRVLNNLNLTIMPGQRVAIVGASGCGKSTIVGLLERFYDVTAGRLLIDDMDIRILNIQWLRSRLALVSQEPVLFNLTISENIAYGHESASPDDIVNAAIRANAHDFIGGLPQGYETKVGMKGHQLSGGEKQRIAIARALLRQPSLLLLDEPTSAMDSNNEQVVQETLERIQTENPKTTTLTIAHRLSTIRSSDVIFVLQNGRIVEMGTHAELMQLRQVYYGMFIQTRN